MSRILFTTDCFNHFKNCLPDVLEEEIARANIRLKLATAPQSDEERTAYQADLNRLTALKYINQLRKGKLSREEFNLKVELTAL